VPQYRAFDRDMLAKAFGLFGPAAGPRCAPGVAPEVDLRNYAWLVLIAFRGGRPLITITDGAAYPRLLALSGVATVLIVRARLRYCRR
jgi:hypothetical protein